VGHAADGGPLRPPPSLQKAGQAPPGPPPANALEGIER
jgi:hypothetical protein